MTTKKFWCDVLIKDIVAFIGGGTPSKSNPTFWNGDIPWASIKDIKGEYLLFTADFITEKGLRNSAANIADSGETIIATRITPGKAITTKIKTAINQDLKIVKTFYRAPQNYIKYLFRSLERKIIKQSSGTTVLGISLNKLNEIPIPLPPLAEQHRIVAKIEELFSRLDKGVEALKTAQAQLKTYRQAVLKWAFEGRLTNENVPDGELPEGWHETKISDIAEIFCGIAFKSESFKSSGLFQVLRIGNIRPGFIRCNENPVFLNEIDESVLIKAKLRINDVVVTQTGTRGKRDYGYTAIIKQNHFLLNQRIAAVRCNEKCKPEYFLYYTWTKKFQNQFFLNETGNVGQGNVGIKAVTGSKIFVPSLSEQSRIVSEIESRLSVCDKLEESIATGLAQAEALRQSILKKAFEGRLVPQDPNDEPASMLLERIRAERAAAELTKPARTKRGAKGGSATLATKASREDKRTGGAKVARAKKQDGTPSVARAKRGL